MEILLIWDIDGTLIQCNGVGRLAMDAAFYRLYGIKNGFRKISMDGKLDRKIVSEAFFQHDISADDLSTFYEKYGKELKVMMSIHKPFVHKGVLDILQRGTESGKILNAVGTGNCSLGGVLKLKYTGLYDYIQLGSYGSDHDFREEMVAEVIEKANEQRKKPFLKENIYVIGDTPRDIEAGKKNDVKTIAVETGSYGKDELEAYKPYAVLPSLFPCDIFYKTIGLK